MGGNLNKTESFSLINESSGILLTARTTSEFHRFGLVYHNEAKRILTHLPSLPSKFSESTIMSQSQATRITATEMIVELESYLNQLLGLSPLLCNMVYVRDFLLNQVIDTKSIRQSTQEISLSLNESNVMAPEEMRDRADSFSLAFD